MLFKTASAVALLAVTTQAAEFMMSSRNVLALGARADEGYISTQSFCGNGTTCSQACGNGFAECASTDSSIHCFNVAAKSICCSDGTGNSCDTGYYCAGSTPDGAICCLEGQNMDDCAKTNGLARNQLTSYAPKPTSSSKPSSYPTQAPNTTTKSTSQTTDCTSTIAPTNTYGAANTTKGSSPTSSPSTVPVSAATLAGPASAFFALAIAGFAAALL